MDKPAFMWISDAYGLNTLHRNEPDLTYKQSMIGKLVERNNQWHVILKDETDIGNYPSLGRAMSALEKHFMSTLETKKNK